MLKILIAKWTKALGEGYVISKSKVKQNYLIVVIDYLKKSIWSNSKRNQKKGPKNQ